jgi:hypothetical protein
MAAASSKVGAPACLLKDGLMSKEAAKRIVDPMLRHGAEQNQVLQDIMPLCSDEDFIAHKRMIGASMAALLGDVMNPIIAIYPDLCPPELKV